LPYNAFKFSGGTNARIVTLVARLAVESLADKARYSLHSRYNPCGTPQLQTSTTATRFWLWPYHNMEC